MTESAMSGLGGMVAGSGAPVEMAGAAPSGRSSARGGARAGGENRAMSDGLFAALLTAALTTTGTATAPAPSASEGESGQASVGSPSTGSSATVPVSGEMDGSSASAGNAAEAPVPAAGAPATSGTPTAASVRTGQTPPGGAPGATGPTEAQARANTAPEAAVAEGEPQGPPPGRAGQSPPASQTADATKQVVVAGERVTNAGQSQDTSRLDRVFVEEKTGERQMEATAPDAGGDAGYTAQVAETAGTSVEQVTASAVMPGETPASDPLVEGAPAAKAVAAPGLEAAPGDSGAQTGRGQGEPTGERQPAEGSERRSAVSARRAPVQPHRSEAKDNTPRLTEAKTLAGEMMEADRKPSEQAAVTSGAPTDAEGPEVKAGPAKVAETAPQPALAAQAAVNKPAEAVAEPKRNEAHAPARAELRELPELVRKAELVARTDGPSEMRLQLVPEHLGRLSVRVSVEEGVVTARLVVENPQVKALVEERLPELTRALQDQGLRLTNVSVGCENSGSNQSFQGWQGERQVPREVAYGSARRGYDDLPAGALGMVPAAASHQWRGSGGVVDALV